MTRVQGRLQRLARASSRTAVLPIVFFATLIATRASLPQALSFDEVHYLPAAKALIQLTDNLNWVHPPLAKLILGAGWLVFSKVLHLISEPTIFRLVSGVFGLWALWSIRSLMLVLRFSPTEALLAVWLTGFNFLWFVQSKIGMLDIFCIAFALGGVLNVFKATAEESRDFYPKWKFWLGWVWLGFAAGTKWSAVPYFLIASFVGANRANFKDQRFWFRRIGGLVVAAIAYLICFIPLAFLATGSVSPADIIAYHERMLGGFDSIAAAAHPYLAPWWKWPLVLRPMWYTFESSPLGERGVWAAVNPVLAWATFPFLFLVLWVAAKWRDRRAVLLASLYWGPLLFWALAPRKLQLFYYYLPSSMMLGPIAVWAHRRYYSEIRETHGWLLLGFTLLCALTFIYFLPVMDFRLLPPGRYYHYMWFRSWI